MHWIGKKYNNLNTYVSNRVAKIQQIKIQILFVPGKENPADLVSKPKPSKDYINNTFLTTGPSFLQQDNDGWNEKYKLDTIIQNNIPETEIDDFQT